MAVCILEYGDDNRPTKFCGGPDQCYRCAERAQGVASAPRGHLDVSCEEVGKRTADIDPVLVQNVARFLCVADGHDPNALVVVAQRSPMLLKNGSHAYFAASGSEALWMAYAQSARAAIAAVDMARENLADNGSEASGVAPAGFKRMPDGVACRCARMWRDGNGVAWCCNGNRALG